VSVLLVTSSYPPIDGGVETYGADVARAVSAIAPCHVLAPDSPGANDYDAHCRPIRVHRYVKPTPDSTPRNPIVSWREIEHGARTIGGGRGRVSRRLRACTLVNRAIGDHAASQATALGGLRDADVRLVLALSVVPSGLIGSALADSLDVPLLTFTHGAELLTWGERPNQRALVGHILRGSRIVGAVSAFTASLLGRYGVAPAHVRRLAPGVDTEAFRGVTREDARARLGIDPTQPVFLTHGRLDPRKGHDTVIRALPQLRKSRPDVVYAITGQGPAREGLEVLARELGVAENVRFAGRIDADEVRVWFAAADAFVMLSRQIGHSVEGFGIVCLEAASAGLPVIAGRSGGVADAVQDGVTGHLVDPESPADFAARALALIADPTRGRALGEEGRIRARTEFDHRAFDERIGTIVREMTGVVNR
jgi:phosphatidylinositol alpha-1,6-mannosyltransferase